MAFFIEKPHSCNSMHLLSSLFRSSRFWITLSLVFVSACSSLSTQPKNTTNASFDSSPSAQMLWKTMDLPGKRKTHFAHTVHEGRQAIKATAHSSVSMLRQQIRVAPQELGTFKFSWNVPNLIEAADMGDRHLDDSAVRLVLAFEGDRAKFSSKNQMLSELSLALTGEELPYATLMYVWCNKRAVGSVITNPRTDRIRKLVVESGTMNLSKWLDYERDIRADFVRAFGEEPAALIGIALMTDTDNTQSKATAWYGPLSFKSAKGASIAVPQSTSD
jgi:hypothetical protein